MKEILFITHKYPPFTGGMEKQSFELVNYASKCNKVVLIACDGSIPKWQFYFSLKRRIKKVLDQNPNISLIHLNDGLMVIMCAWIKDKYDIPITATLHGLDIVFPWSIYQNKIKKSLLKMNQLYCVSHATAQECEKLGVSNSKIVVIENGVDHELSKLEYNDNILEEIQHKIPFDTTKKNIIVTYGRPARRKGVVWFLEKVLPKLPSNCILLMAGPLKKKHPLRSLVWMILPTSLKRKINFMFGIDDDSETIQKYLDDPKYKNRFAHLGKLPFKQLMQLLSRSDIFVMPNIKVPGDFEGFGLVALEAGLRNTTVIASKMEGICSAIKNNKNGILINSQDEAAWIQKINSVIEKPDYYAQFNKESIVFIKENYGWTKMGESYMKHFDQLINESKNPSYLGMNLQLQTRY